MVVLNSVSVELVHRDLELKRAVQHCRCLVDFIGDGFTSTLVEVDVADSHRVHDVRVEPHTLPKRLS